MTGASQATLYWRRVAGPPRVKPLIGVPAPLLGTLPVSVGHVVTAQWLACTLLRDTPEDTIVLVLGHADHEALERFLPLVAGLLGEMLVNLERFEMTRERLSRSLGDRQLLLAGLSRQAILAKVAAAVGDATGPVAIVVSDEGNHNLRALVHPLHLTADIKDEEIQRALYAALSYGSGVILHDELCDRLSSSLSLNDLVDWYYFTPVSVQQYFTGLIGIGLAAGWRARQGAGQEASDSTAAQARVMAQLEVIGLLRIVAHEIEDWVWCAALREEGFLAGMRREEAYLGMELHDTLLQELSYIRLLLRRLELAIPTDNERARGIAHELTSSVQHSLHEARRLSLELSAAEDQPAELAEAIRAALDAFKDRFQGSVELQVEGDKRNLGPTATGQLIRVFQEALHNVLGHAEATEVVVRLQYAGDGLELSISDNGRGFAPEERHPGHLGLAGMERRVRELGGTLDIEGRPGNGTTIRVVVPDDASANPGACLRASE